MSEKPTSSVTRARRLSGMLTLVLVPFIALPEAGAQSQIFFYPSKGQSADQQKRDQYECYNWAVGQTGYDPSNPPVQASAAAPPVTSSPLRGAAGGAAIGAIGGAIGGNAGKGAAIGAGTGALIGGIRRQSQIQQQQAAQAQRASSNAAGRDSYNRALSACMQGRGYAAN